MRDLYLDLPNKPIFRRNDKISKKTIFVPKGFSFKLSLAPLRFIEGFRKPPIAPANSYQQH